MMTTYTTNDAAGTVALAAAVAQCLRPGDLVVLTGDLGAGKTTFVKGLAAGLTATDPVTSPTFTIVQEYDARIPIAHVDVYRVERIQELHDLGFEELLDGRVVVIEWGEAVARVLPRDRLEIRLAMTERDHERVIDVVPHGPGWSTRVRQLDSALAAVGTA